MVWWNHQQGKILYSIKVLSMKTLSLVATNYLKHVEQMNLLLGQSHTMLHIWSLALTSYCRSPPNVGVSRALFFTQSYTIAKEFRFRNFHSEDLLHLCVTSCVLRGEICIILPFVFFSYLRMYNEIYNQCVYYFIKHKIMLSFIHWCCTIKYC